MFRAAGFSHGTIGFLTSLTLRIVPAESELLVTYYQYASIEALHSAYKLAIDDHDAFFLESIIFSQTKAVLIRGDLIDASKRTQLASQGVPHNPQGRWYKRWFFDHAGRVPDGHQELMPMRDYLMRHDSSLCMTMLYVFPYGNNPLVRYLFGWMLPPKISFLKALRPPEVRIETIWGQAFQDLAFPLEKLPEMIDKVDSELGIFPLLCYPCKIIDRGGYIRHPGNHGKKSSTDNLLKPVEKLYLNLGVYGIPRGVREQQDGFNNIAAIRSVLDFVRSIGGFQHTYCDVFQSRAEFEEMFDHELGRQVRKRLGSEMLPSVYDKVKLEVEWEHWVGL